MIFYENLIGTVLFFIGFFHCSVQSTSTNDSVVIEANAALKPVFENLEKQFNVLKYDELQVALVTNLYGSLNFLNKGSDPRIKLDNLAEKLKINIDIITAVLERAKSGFKTHNSTSIAKYKQSVIVPCKDDANDDISEPTDTLLNDTSENSVGEILRILYYDLWGLKNALKKVYFLSLSNTPFSANAEVIDNFCQVDHSKLWKTYMSHNIYKTRRVILLLDHGNSIDDSLLTLSKSFAKQMISVLNENDKFTIIAMASKWSSLTVAEPCGNQHLPSILAATDNNKELSYSFIDELSSQSEITDHNIGIKTAMKMARLFYAGEETVMLVYISPGMQFSMSEAMDLITVSDLSSPIIVNTCSVSSGALPDVHDMNILSDIMNDFFIEKNINKNHRISRGHLAFINDQSSIGPAVARFYEMYSSRLHRTTTKVSLPAWDTVSQDLTTSFSIGFPIGNRFVVLGVDLHFSSFLRDVIYYSNYQHGLGTILMDSSGTVLIHSAIPPRKLEKQINFAHISKYLPQDFDSDMFFEKTEGTLFSEETSKTYIWKHVGNIYVICMIVDNIEEVPLVPSKLNWLPTLANSQLVSYLIDLASSNTVCKQFGHITNMDSPSLFLGQSCFHHSSQKTNESITLKLLPYFQRETLLLKHEGLQEGVRDELAGLVQATDFLKKKHLDSINRDYVIRRYAATKTGIAHIFPGASLSPNFEPSKRLWFLRADEMRGRVIVSSPYLDAGGSGYIVTISLATPFVVVGIDVTYGFILKMMLEQNVDCVSNTCFLVDDRGYLISHPDIITLENENEPVEQLHIVHKESSVANDLLNHEELVQKLACSDYTTATIQRYYQLNLSYPDVLTSSVLGEPCVSYSVGAIKGTNLFFGIVKAACRVTRTFCPCSVVDRLCLNCGNMEKHECECPCECQIRRSSCSNFTSHDSYEICDTALKGYSSEPIFNVENPEGVEQCPSSNCETKSTYLSCLGVVGCEWCKKDTYGFNLEAPFCSSISACFNGVLGGPSPYKEGNLGNGHMFSSIKNTGFVIGLIVVFGIVFTLILVCIRSYNNNVPRNSRAYLSSRQEHMHMSDFNINEDYLEQGNHCDKLLIKEKKRTPLSPYCVTTNYSRPATAADSDHGYSTMTPHDESEHLSLAPIEIDSLEEDISSERATPPVKHKAQMTRIPHKNCIIVPVTVHRHVDAS